MPTMQVRDLYSDLKTALLSAEIEPLIVTKMHKKTYTIMSYELYEQTIKTIDDLTRFRFDKRPYTNFFTYSVTYPYRHF
jgi:hypothetical protein